MNQPDQVMLTPHQAYLVMLEFLRQYYERGKSDDIGALLGGLLLLNSESANPAYYSYDWESAARAVLDAESTPDGYREADFRCMS